MPESPIRNVSDTAVMVAAFRAAESERPNALFRDPLAARLAGEHGQRIVARIPKYYPVTWSIAIRTVIIDEFLRSAIAGGVDMVVNLGAGLDARPYRMDLPASLRWVEVDLPHMIELKESRLAGETPRCAVERVKLDLTDRAARQQLLADLNARTNRILVLTEGVVPYLREEDVATLADELRAADKVRTWILDYFSPRAMQFRDRQQRGGSLQNAPFKFRPADWFGFFRQHGWAAKEIRYLTEEAERLGRPMPLPLPMKIGTFFFNLFMSREQRLAMRRFTGLVVLERG